MSIRVYNTQSQKKEEFVSLEAGKVGIYVCGVTPYNHPHIGNARPFVTWDVIHRYLEAKGFEVTHIQNFTDVDDKIINAAAAREITWKELADEFIGAYFEVMDQLNVKRIDVYPRVSDHMQEIIQMVETLVEKGHAYAVGGDVYFAVEKFERYGALSHRTLDDMQAGARVEVDERKRHPMDFALWKSAKFGEPSWSSPWGEGRPGWHIECSAMSIKYLSDQFDFHGGGSDLIFPHHENEIAQSECCTGIHPFVKYWLHNGFITINQEKMSKSLDNFFLVKDILLSYSGEVIRFFLLSSHYRSPLDFSDERLNEAKKGWERLFNAHIVLQKVMEKTKITYEPPSEDLLERIRKIDTDFEEAMEDDFNTSLAYASLFGMAKEINQMNSKNELNLKEVEEISAVWSKMINIVGLFETEGEPEIYSKTDENALLDLLISLREEARKEKNWKLSDRIRNGLQDCGIILEDTAVGVRWKRSEV